VGYELAQNTLVISSFSISQVYVLAGAAAFHPPEIHRISSKITQFSISRRYAGLKAQKAVSGPS